MNTFIVLGKKLTKVNKDLIKTQLKTKVYLENLKYSIEYATGVLDNVGPTYIDTNKSLPRLFYDDYDDHDTQFILKHVQI
jgi:hypothetical protein